MTKKNTGRVLCRKFQGKIEIQCNLTCDFIFFYLEFNTRHCNPIMMMLSKLCPDKGKLILFEN